MGSAELHLRWSSYESTLLTSVNDLWDLEAMTDVSLSADDGRIIRAHRVVLSSCSGYFKEVLQNITHVQHPIVMLPFVCHQDLLAVIQFMYRGEINITQPDLPGLLACAESLRVKGLAKINPLRASGLLQQACQQDNITPNCNGKLVSQRIKLEPDFWNTHNSLSYGEDEEAVEIREVSENQEETEHLIVDEGDGRMSDCQDSADDESNMSGGEQNEGKLYFLTSLGQHDELMEDEHEEPDELVPSRESTKPSKNRRRLYRALTAAWTDSGPIKKKERPSPSSVPNNSLNSHRHNNGQRSSSIRKTLMPVSCPVCFKVLSNAYNLKVHMSIHDGLNHQCSVCGHTSKSRDALRKHLAYRHLIGMSGPVRPRLPAGKRRRASGVNGNSNPERQSNEQFDSAGASPPPSNYQDSDILPNSGGDEDTDLSHPPDTSW